MDLVNYQAAAMKNAVYPSVGSNLIYPALGLAGEAGEYCNKLKKLQRDDNNILTEERRGQLIRELGDVLWYVAACAFELGISLDTVAFLNVAELSDRQKHNKLHGSGDTRGMDAETKV
jgi:NTP pyrophosphatase (non-canonical NTP hydrolase)